MRRRHILEAAMSVFAERGYRGATIRDVAREAGVADGTIYNVFENKAALLYGLLDPLADSAPAGTPVPSSLEPAAFLEDLFARRWASFTPDALAMLRVILSEALVDPDIRAEFLARVIAPPMDLAQPMIASMIAEGRLAAGDAALTLRALSALILGLVMLRLIGEPEIERRADEVPVLLARLLAEGLRPRSNEPGRHEAHSP